MTAISLKIIKKTIQKVTSLGNKIDKTIKDATIRILSESGSIFLPKLVIKLYFLAIYPSKNHLKKQ